MASNENPLGPSPKAQAAMVEAARDLVFSPDFAAKARAALVAGKPILCDSKMVANGVTKARLPAGNQIVCALDDPKIRDVAALPDDWAADREYLEAEGITAILEVPLVRAGVLVGVIGFESITGAVPCRAFARHRRRAGSTSPCAADD